MVSNYFLQNWTLILILLAFTATLRTTVFLDRKTIDRMYVLIVLIFLLSICVYVEFLLGDLGVNRPLRRDRKPQQRGQRHSLRCLHQFLSELRRYGGFLSGRSSQRGRRQNDR